MVEAQRIACQNGALFMMSFEAVWVDGKSYNTGNYAFGRIHEIDMAEMQIKPGTEFWPVVHAEVGNTETSPDHIVFAMNGMTARYEVKGMTLDYKIIFQGADSDG